MKGRQIHTGKERQVMTGSGGTERNGSSRRNIKERRGQNGAEGEDAKKINERRGTNMSGDD